MANGLDKKTALIVDSGLYTHMAEKLAESFGRTLYFNEWRGQFPTSKWAMIGKGLKGLHRVTSLWDNVDKADIIIFLDVYNGDIQRFLRSQGYRVWGNGDAEELEFNRAYAKKLMASAGMPVNEFEVVNGLDDLITSVKKREDLWIKGGPFRGDFESKHFDNIWVDQSWFDEQRMLLGPGKEDYEYIIEAPIPGVEVGYDGFSVDGQFPKIASYGYETKDAGYLGKVYEDGAIPTPIREILSALSPFLRSTMARGFLSVELRIGKTQKPYLLDPCMRCGSPPSEAYCELFSNWAEVIWEGSSGQLVDLEPAARFAAELILKSGWSKDNWLAVDVPTSVKRWVKLHNHCRIDGIDYVVPTGIEEIGAVVGIGSTLAGAIEACYNYADELKAYQLAYDDDAFEGCLEAIREGKTFGIDW